MFCLLDLHVMFLGAMQLRGAAVASVGMIKRELRRVIGESTRIT